LRKARQLLLWAGEVGDRRKREKAERCCAGREGGREGWPSVVLTHGGEEEEEEEEEEEGEGEGGGGGGGGGSGGRRKHK